MALTPEELAACLPNKRGKASAVKTIPGTGNAWVKITDPDNDAYFHMERMEVKSSTFGKFHNKAGTKKRGAKGNVTINPDGYSRYINPALGGEIEVVAYRA